MIRTVEFHNTSYPAFQASGNAARFIIPFAKEVCKGVGLDIGCNREEWAFPGAIMVDETIDDEWHANNLPEKEYDYIFSSHCLEHVPNWSQTLDYWTTRIKIGGVLFLYLPHYFQEYWRPWNNQKHLNVMMPQVITDYLEARKIWINVFASDIDLNSSFAVMAEKTQQHL